MKKIKFKIILCLLLSFFLTQQIQAQRFKAGLVAGFNMAQIEGDLLNGYHKLGLNGGIKVYTIFNDRWEMGLSFLYSQKGSAAARTDYLGSTYQKIKLNFVEVPVMVHFNEWKFKLGTGLSYARLINYEVIDVLGNDITAQQLYNDNLISFVVGLSYMSSDHLLFNFRWSKSINNIFDNSDSGVFRSNVIALRVIYVL